MTSHPTNLTRSSLAPALAAACAALLAPAASAQFDIGPATNYFVGTQPGGMAAGDFNGDTFADLATAVDGPDRIATLINNGSGAYLLGPSSLTGSSTSPQDVEAADLNGDGIMDLAVAVRDPVGAVVIMIGSGTGTFAASATVPVGDRPRGITIADIDNDGDRDIAVANRDSGSASILRNSGGVFTVQTLAVGGETRHTALGDFDGDGDGDMAVTDHDNRSVVIFRNNGASFGAWTTVFVAPQVRPDGIVAAQLNGTGPVDLAVAVSDQTLNINQAAVFLSTGTGFTGPTGFNTLGSNTSDIVAADLDCDGMMDLATSNQDSNNVSLLRNLGNATFAPATLMASGTNPEELAAADLDGDGDSDLATANRNSNNVSVLLNDTCVPKTPCPADVDGDGFVSVTDLTALILAWGPNAGHPADIDGNGTVDVQDLTALILSWGACPA